MHELSIAMSIVDGACEEAERLSAARVEAVHLRLGRLSGVVKEALLFSYDLVAADTAIAGSRLKIEDVDAAIFCDECEAERELISIQNFACPVCGKASSNAIRGRELTIVGLELESEYAAAAG